MKLYRCDFCGRVFGQKTPHMCFGGCFRKHSIAFAEFDDADFEYIKKTDIVPQGALILQEQAEPKIEFMVNWEQRRYEIAKSAMNAMLANPELLQVVTSKEYVVGTSCHNRVAKVSVDYADALIAELKRKDD